MKRRYGLLAAVGSMLFLCLCNNRAVQKDILAFAGSTLITQQDADVFDAVARLTPVRQDTFGLLAMDPVSGQIATEIIYQKVHWNRVTIRIWNSREWKWKKRYLIARMYAFGILQKNCGFTDAALRDYYNAHKEEFRTEDTAGAVPPFDSIRLAVARKCFFSTYKPDSTFMDLSNPGNFRYFLTDAYPEYFMKKFYKEKYGIPLSNTLKELRGKRSIINERDIQAACPLLAAYERVAFEKDPVPFIRSLLQWKLFSEKAKATGFTTVPLVRKFLEWAWKVEVAQRWVNETIVPLVKNNVFIDSAMALYSYLDEGGTAAVTIDSAKLKKHVSNLVYRQMVTKFDSLMYPILRARKVKFLHDIWTDVKCQDPVLLHKKADSLRDAGTIPEAYGVYSILALNYAFTSQGRNALLDLAKIQTEQEGNRLEAIKNYRRFLINCRDTDKRVEIMYLIGFIYDRYCDNPEMAEINYQWVLKNAFGSRQARDAEVMMQHLGEPMPGSEELQAEAKRQGKN